MIDSGVSANVKPLTVMKTLIKKGKCEKDRIWKMNFHGNCSRTSYGARIVFTSPKGDKLSYAYLLEFDSTNNAIEHKVLILGLI